MKEGEIGGLFSVFSLAMLIIKPLIGRWADYRGYKSLLVVGMFLYAIAFGVFAGIKGVGSLYAARAIQAVAAAAFGIATYGIVTRSAKEHDIAQQLGERTAATTKGILIGSGLCFFVLYGAGFIGGWKRLFIIFAIAAVIGGLIVIAKVPESEKRPTRHEPMKKMRKKLSREILKLLLITFITSVASSMLGPMLMIYLQDRFTNNLVLLACAFMPSTIVYSVLAVRIGRMSDKYGRVKVMIIGLLVSGGISLMIPVASSLSMLGVLWCVDSVGELLSTPAEQAFYYELANEDQIGEMYGIYSMVGSLGSVVGPLLGGVIYERISPDLTFYVQGAWLGLAGLLAWIFFRRYESINE